MMSVEDLIEWIAKQWWVSYVLLSVFIFILLLLNRGLRIAFNRMEQLASKKGGWRYHTIVFSLRKPLRLGIFALGVLLFLRVFLFKELTDLVLLIDIVVRATFLLAFTWVGVRLIFCVEERCRETKKGFGRLDKDASKALCRIGKISLIVAMILLLMDTIGIKISALLAFGGLGGIVLGFASRDALSNVFGGLMLVLDRPFSEGDWIRSPDREIEGTVVKIGWRTTVIETFSKRPLYVPNSLFSTISVENPSRMRNRRIKELIGVSYDDMDKVDAIVEDIEHFIHADSRIDDKQTSFARVVQFDSSSINILLYCFTKTTRWVEFQEQKQAIMLEIAKIIDEHGAKIPFPTQTLHVVDQTSILKSMPTAILPPERRRTAKKDMTGIAMLEAKAKKKSKGAHDKPQEGAKEDRKAIQGSE